MEAKGNLMATTAQISANQQNSHLSTGPRSPEGKAVSSANARTHGFNASDPVLPTEDRREFNELLARNKSEWMAETVHQQFLVEQMTGAQWKLNRLGRMETEMFAALDSPEKAFTDKDTAAGFARLDRYRAALERTYHRCARELRADQRVQIEPKSEQLAEKKYLELLEHLFAGPSDEFLKLTLADYRQRQAALNPGNKVTE
jgi:hypothetical protein